MIDTAKTVVGRIAGRLADWCADQSAPCEPDGHIVITLRLPDPPPRPEPERAIALLRTRSKRARVSKFMGDALALRPNGTTSLRALYKRYYSDETSGEDVLRPAEFGVEVRAVLDAWGLKYERSGDDVVVRGAALS